jgi:hypothetical protein
MFLLGETPQILQSQPLRGGAVADFFHELANWRAELEPGDRGLDENVETRFCEYVTHECQKLASRRGGVERMALRHSDIERIAGDYNGPVKLLKADDVFNAIASGDLGSLAKGMQFFQSMAQLRGQVRADSIWRGLAMIEQDKMRDHANRLYESFKDFTASETGTDEHGLQFLMKATGYSRRVHQTRLDPLKVLDIDLSRALFYMSLRIYNPRLGAGALREKYWLKLEEIAQTRMQTLDAAMAHQAQFFKETDFRQPARATAGAPMHP